MSVPPPLANPAVFDRLFGWVRIRYPLLAVLIISLLFLPTWEASYLVLIGRLLFIGLAGVLAFGTAEVWPVHLPSWMARWAFQVAAVAFAMPVAVLFVYTVTTWDAPQYWWHDDKRLSGFFEMTMFGLLIAPWMSVSALFRQINGTVQNQALAFELERSQLERRALDARMHLLQAQVEPHFLFNTLANVRELVVSGAPQAASVLESLISYLRAAVPQLHQTGATLGQELELVRSYLELMHMRMPDRLAFAIEVDVGARMVEFPPMTLLTLVENAVRHGIDPSETGGRIDVRVVRLDGRCRAQVADTGVGMRPSADAGGTGLAMLRERLQLVFGGDTSLRITAVVPHGVCAEIDFPARLPAP